MEQILQVPFLDLVSQIRDLRNEIVESISSTIESANFILGPEWEEYELEFASCCECKYAIGTSSGAPALHLALLAIGVGPGDELISLPSYSELTKSQLIDMIEALGRVVVSALHLSN